MDENDDKLLPKSVGEKVTEPIYFVGQRKELANRLDTFFSMNGRVERPSDWLNGAVFVSQNKLKVNADWVAQATHSLREILYRLNSPQLGGGSDTMKQFLTNYGSAQNLQTSIERLGRMYGKLCDIAHHKTKIEDTEEGDFETLLSNFEKIMSEALERQLDVHKKIDEILLQNP